MGITFISGNNDKVQNIKEKCAHAINDLETFKKYHESDNDVSPEKLAAIESSQEDFVTAGLKAELAAKMA